MLINLTPNKIELERRRAVAKDHNFEFTPQCDHSFIQETGIYQSSFPFNFPEEEFHEKLDHLWDNDKTPYGVADNIEQIKNHFCDEVNDPDNKYIIALTAVFQHKGQKYGWRWHKWGEYIGKLNPMYEYLDDEDFGPDFKYVICFKIYLVN